MSRIADFADLRDIAKKRLPRPIFDYVEGGAGSEVTLRRNRRALDELELTPRVMRDVSQRDMSCVMLGR